MNGYFLVFKSQKNLHNKNIFYLQIKLHSKIKKNKHKIYIYIVPNYHKKNKIK